VITYNNPLNLILIVNSILIVLFILNQNESNKDLLNAKKSDDITNPFEKVTWAALIFEFIILLIKIKNPDF
jgi:preprotein translocase subunit SecG